MPIPQRIKFAVFAFLGAALVSAVGLWELAASIHDPSSFRRLCYVAAFPLTSWLNVAVADDPPNFVWDASVVGGFVLWFGILYGVFSYIAGAPRCARSV